MLTPSPKQPQRSYSLYKKLEYIRYYEQQCFGNKHRFEATAGDNALVDLSDSEDDVDDDDDA